MTLYNPCQAYASIEQSGVHLIDIDAARKDPAARLWSWSAADSPEIRPEDRELFCGYDECKPVMGGSAVLACSSWSVGGVALVRREDKRCLFYAAGTNAHSAELIEGDILAAAFSNMTGTVRLYDLRKPQAGPAEADWSMPFASGHGVLWDRRQKVLYALGLGELAMLRVTRRAAGIEGKVLMRYALPSAHGHELSPWDERHLVVAVNKGVYHFDMAAGTFAPMDGIGDAVEVKSVSRNVVTGQVMYTKGQLPSANTDRIQFIGGEDLPLATKLLYKARWNQPNDFAYEG
jgi:hypothetical protein